MSPSLLSFGIGLLGIAMPQVAPPTPPVQPTPAPAAQAPAPAKVERVAPTFENVHVDAAELPAGFTLETTPAFVSPQAATLVDGQLGEALGPVLTGVKRKDFQTVASKDGRSSIAYLEFASTSVPDDAKQFVEGLVWGPGGSSKIHPEQIVRAGNVLVVASVKPGDPAGEWMLERLRRRFGMRFRTDWGPLRTQASAVLLAYNQKDPARGLKLLKGESAQFGARSVGAYLEGEFCTMSEDWPAAEKAYARALELDATSDPLPDDGVYCAVVDGHGTSFWGLKRYEDGAKTLLEAAKLAAALKKTAAQAQSLYNAACCLALLGKADEAMGPLAESLKLDAQLKEHSKTDTDLDSLRSREDFKKLYQ